MKKDQNNKENIYKLPSLFKLKYLGHNKYLEKLKVEINIIYPQSYKMKL